MSGPVWMCAEQGTDQWLRERVGCLTASRMADAMAQRRRGGESAARRRLICELVAERLTDRATERAVTQAMEWGIAHEPMARARYEEVTGLIVTPCGFARHGDIPWFGASPDGLVGDDGLIEIKCPSTATFVEWAATKQIPYEYQMQMAAQLAVTARKWCDFFAFDPRIRGRAHQHVLLRYEPSAEQIAEVEEAAKSLLADVDSLIQTITGNSR